MELKVMESPGLYAANFSLIRILNMGPSFFSHGRFTHMHLRTENYLVLNHHARQLIETTNECAFDFNFEHQLCSKNKLNILHVLMIMCLRVNNFYP